MTIKFFIQSNLKKHVPIYVRLRDGEVDAKAKTNFSVLPQEWSAAKEKVRERDASAKMLNGELLNLRKRISDRHNMRRPLEEINSDWLKLFLNPPPQVKPLPNDLLEYLDSYIEAKEVEVKQGDTSNNTVKQCNVYKKLITGMQTELKIRSLVEDVSPEFIKLFEKHCIKHGYAPNTIARVIKFLKTIGRDARKRGLSVHKDLDNIEPKFQDVTHTYLTFDELERIERKELPDYLDNARDWLLISCETGQRVSDFMRFTKDMIRAEKGEHLIEFTQAKTKKLMAIPITEKVFDILNKRNGEFPRAISDQKYNDYIKEVCRLAEINQKVKGSRMNREKNRKESGVFEKWELVSSHIGRRSAATNYYGLVPTPLLMHLTGHTTEREFLNYIKKEETDKAHQLAGEFRKLSLGRLRIVA